MSSEHKINEPDAERQFLELVQFLKPIAVRILRSLVPALFAVILSKTQSHAAYSGLLVFFSVAILASFRNFHLLASAIVGWLLMLNFATPEIIGLMKAL